AAYRPSRLGAAHEARTRAVHPATNQVANLPTHHLFEQSPAHARHYMNSICTSATSIWGLLSTAASTFCSTWSTNDWSLLTQANPSVARRHESSSSTSAAETLNRSRMRSRVLLITCRLSFRDWLPGMRSWRVQMPTTMGKWV